MQFEEAQQQAIRLEAEDNVKAAVLAAKRALNLGEELDLNPEQIADLHFNYGYVLKESGELVEACKNLQKSFDINEDEFSKFSPQLTKPADQLATCYARTNRPRRADYYFQTAKIIANRNYGTESFEYAMALFNHGAAKLMHMNTDSGRQDLEESLALLKSVRGPSSPETLVNEFTLAKADLSARQLDLAIERLNRILDVALSTNQPDVELSIRAFLVEAYELNEQGNLATQHCLAIGRKTPAEGERNAFPVFELPPQYPRRARGRHKVGWVDIEYNVDKEGFVRDAQIIDRNSYSRVFDEASLETLNRSRYAPAFEEGEPVEVKGLRRRFEFKRMRIPLQRGNTIYSTATYASKIP